MTQAEYIIGKFGGMNSMASRLGHRNSSTVQGWQQRGFIPPRRYPEILLAAQKFGVVLKPEDFVQHLYGDEIAATQMAVMACAIRNA